MNDATYPPPRTWQASVWCARWDDSNAHTADPWGIGVPGFKYGDAPELCVHCERRRLAELAELGQVPTDGATIPIPEVSCD